jgi:hypothetical protein
MLTSNQLDTIEFAHRTLATVSITDDLILTSFTQFMFLDNGNSSGDFWVPRPLISDVSKPFNHTWLIFMSMKDMNN